MKTALALAIAAALIATPAVADQYVADTCNQGECATYYLTRTSPSHTAHEVLARVRAVGVNRGIEIYLIRCAKPGHVFGAGQAVSEPNSAPSNATSVADAIWAKVCGWKAQ
jgi:hypothetical protein